LENRGMNDAVSVKSLSKYYNDHLAVDNISFNVRRGEVFGFLGPNGAGKTTTIKMLVGLTVPSSGTASVAGYDIIDDIVEVKRRVGVVPETSNLYDELTVWENLLFASRLYHVPKQERSERIESLLKTFHLVERRKTKFGKLSKGLKRRAVIAAAMVHQPEIVFLDEPTAGLDVMSALSLREFIGKLRAEDTTVFLTTHYIEEADQLSDRIAILLKGKITTIDTSENIKRSVRGTPVIEAFLSTESSGKGFEELGNYGNVELNGQRIRIETVNVSEAFETLVQLTSRKGIRIEEVNTVRPTLESAFVKLTGVTPETMKVEKERGRR
jgi:ABC-2 type transport system ATP-binding protein